MLKRVLIANRGEIAVRVIRACQTLGIETVAVYSEADRDAPHVLMADAAYHIGAAPPNQSYLQQDVLLTVAQESGADSIHPGYGFLSENADFAEAVHEAGLIWIGPPAAAIRAMGVKTEARSLMQSADVPVVPGYQSVDASDDDWLTAADAIGYPVMVKAAGGGGGKGIRIVRKRDSLLDEIQSARREASKAFNDARIFLEKYIEQGRHIEIQVLADKHGNTIHLFERECSTQRRHQKIIEESPSPVLTQPQRQAMGRAAVAAAEAVDYVNAGTVEFIVTDEGDFYFLEMNTRLQVEHPVTEMVTGIDLVQWQLRIASGEPLTFEQGDIHQQGHAIECRIYAEDARNNFLPAIGTVNRFEAPQAPGIRTDSGIVSGSEITIHYDPMIAKLIVSGHNRQEAIRRMQSALDQMVILGTTTNVEFLRSILTHPVFLEGNVHTRFVDEHLDSLLPDVPPLTDDVLIAAALSELLALGDTSQAVRASSNGGDAYSPWNRADSFRLGE